MAGDLLRSGQFSESHSPPEQGCIFFLGRQFKTVGFSRPARRAREIGVGMAIGARVEDIRKMIFSEAVRLVVFNNQDFNWTLPSYALSKPSLGAATFLLLVRAQAETFVCPTSRVCIDCSWFGGEFL